MLALRRQHAGQKGETDGAVVNVNLLDVGYCDHCYSFSFCWGGFSIISRAAVINKELSESI